MNGCAISRLLGLAMILILCAAFAGADVPQLINYQGRLTDVDDQPVADGTYDITFTVYRTDEAVVWTSGPQPVLVINGLFNYALGSAVPLPLTVISTNYDRFLGIKVGSDPELVPRTQLISVPYAYKVGSIEGAAGGSVSGTLTLSDAGITFPTTDGTPGQAMTTDGAGNLGWFTPVRVVAPPVFSTDPGNVGDVAFFNQYFYWYDSGFGWRRVLGSAF